jgi:hypothetical protein
MFIPDPDFFPIPDPGVKKAADLGSGSATLLGCSIKKVLKDMINTVMFCKIRTGKNHAEATARITRITDITAAVVKGKPC